MIQSGEMWGMGQQNRLQNQAGDRAARWVLDPVRGEGEIGKRRSGDGKQHTLLPHPLKSCCPVPYSYCYQILTVLLPSQQNGSGDEVAGVRSSTCHCPSPNMLLPNPHALIYTADWQQLNQGMWWQQCGSGDGAAYIGMGQQHKLLPHPLTCTATSSPDLHCCWGRSVGKGKWQLHIEG